MVCIRARAIYIKILHSLLSLFFLHAKFNPFHGYVELSPIPKAIYSTLCLSGITSGQNSCLDNPLHQLVKSAYLKKKKSEKEVYGLFFKFPQDEIFPTTVKGKKMLYFFFFAFLFKVFLP